MKLRKIFLTMLDKITLEWAKGGSDMHRWLYNLVRYIYAPKQETFPQTTEPFDLVVPLDYAALETGALPDATIRCLQKAAGFIRADTAQKMAWGNTGYFGPGASALHEEKIRVLKELGLPEKCVRFRTEIDNSIQEAEKIHAACPEAHRILLVCDWPHARRARIIWKHYYPDAVIAVYTVEAQWNENHPSHWAKSDAMWLLANILHHALLSVVGIEHLRTLRHAVS